MTKQPHLPPKIFRCTNCLKEVRGKWMDFGIGSYEYEGRKGFDQNLAWVSECCESEIVEGSEAEGWELADWPEPPARIY